LDIVLLRERIKGKFVTLEVLLLCESGPRVHHSSVL
jgi:hypothetical protein